MQVRLLLCKPCAANHLPDGRVRWKWLCGCVGVRCGADRTALKLCVEHRELLCTIDERDSSAYDVSSPVLSSHNLKCTTKI
jgi:hypothetical protein